jgi:hypothetical protein
MGLTLRSRYDSMITMQQGRLLCVALPCAMDSLLRSPPDRPRRMMPPGRLPPTYKRHNNGQHVKHMDMVVGPASLRLTCQHSKSTLAAAVAGPALMTDQRKS